MDLLPKIVLAALLCGMSACTFLPGIDDEQPYTSESCELITQSLDLKAYWGFSESSELNSSSQNTSEAETDKIPKSDNSFFSGGSNRSDDFIFRALLAWGASTLIISGSIVVSGNILHWSEYQGRCDESELRQFVYQL